ncbi:MAG: hypothetical protein HDT14_05400 [Oscillibacter sp.]|nr:hypothetical protein [Oscillibacter sp.]
MASNLSQEDREYFESLLAKAEPYPEDDSIWSIFDGEERDSDRVMATFAKMALEGRLR